MTEEQDSFQPKDNMDDKSSSSASSFPSHKLSGLTKMYNQFASQSDDDIDYEHAGQFLEKVKAIEEAMPSKSSLLCPKCGTEFADRHRVCAECGFKLPQQISSMALSPEVESKPRFKEGQNTPLYQKIEKACTDFIDKESSLKKTHKLLQKEYQRVAEATESIFKNWDEKNYHELSPEECFLFEQASYHFDEGFHLLLTLLEEHGDKDPEKLEDPIGEALELILQASQFYIDAHHANQRTIDTLKETINTRFDISEQ